MRHLFTSWGEVAARLNQASRIALFLDFDGTLARLRPTPEEVTFERTFRQALTALARSPRFYVWIVSGRRQADIRERIGVPGIRYLGLHGWEGRSGPPLSEACTTALAGVKSWAGGLFANSTDVWVEDKGYSLSIHYRETPSGGLPLAEMLDGMLEPFKDVLHVIACKNVQEVLPRELEDKGAAVRHQIGAVCSYALPVYLGDDSIDEPAFVELRRGITVRVGRVKPTKARYRLSHIGEVRSFLQRLAVEFA